MKIENEVLRLSELVMETDDPVINGLWQTLKTAVLAQQTTNTGSLKFASDIVESLASWCNRYPESSTSPYAGIKEFREIERKANDFVAGKLQAGA
jgi:hypothetical protein